MRGSGILPCMEQIWGTHQDEGLGGIWVICQSGNLRGDLGLLPGWGRFGVLIRVGGLEGIWSSHLHGGILGFHWNLGFFVGMGVWGGIWDFHLPGGIWGYHWNGGSGDGLSSRPLHGGGIWGVYKDGCGGRGGWGFHQGRGLGGIGNFHPDGGL